MLQPLVDLVRDRRWQLGRSLARSLHEGQQHLIQGDEFRVALVNVPNKFFLVSGRVNILSCERSAFLVIAFQKSHPYFELDILPHIRLLPLEELHAEWETIKLLLDFFRRFCWLVELIAWKQLAKVCVRLPSLTS